MSGKPGAPTAAPVIAHHTFRKKGTAHSKVKKQFVLTGS